MSYSEEKLKWIKTRLLVSYPFFGSAVSDLPFKPSPSVLRIYADGSWLNYNPEFVETANPGEIAYWLCREILQLTMDHEGRRRLRSRVLWAMAVEYCVNAILTEEGLSGSVQVRFFRRGFTRKSAEEIYAILVREIRDLDMLGQIELMDQSIEESQSDTQTETDLDLGLSRLSKNIGTNRAWLVELIIESARRSNDYGQYKAKTLEMISKAKLSERTMGKTGFAVDLPLIGHAQETIPWEELLLDYAINDRAERSYRRFQRKYLHGEIYLPQLYHRFNSVVMALDVSASVPDSTLNSFFSDVLYLIQSRAIDTKIRVIQIDAAIQADFVVSPMTPPDQMLRRKGFGGTDFTPLFNKLEQEHNADPLVIFTDGRGIFPSSAPEDYDVIWITTDLKMPWGINLSYEVRG